MTQASPTGIIIGVDTHKHTHTAVAITGLGTRVSVLHGCAGWRKGRPVSMLRISPSCRTNTMLTVATTFRGRSDV
jgi:hypothetical protein